MKTFWNRFWYTSNVSEVMIGCAFIDLCSVMYRPDLFPLTILTVTIVCAMIMSMCEAGYELVIDISWDREE